MKLTTLVLCLFLSWGISRAQTGEKNFIDQNYIEVTGTAEMEIVPDEIYLKIVLSEKDKGKKSLEKNPTCTTDDFQMCRFFLGGGG